MKKLVTVLIAVFLVFSLVPAAMAAQQVEVKTNSEGVTALPLACEKAGNISFIFDAGTIIRDGDWWTADLPLGVTLCHDIDFAVLGTSALPVPFVNGGEFVTTAVVADGTSLDNGMWSINDLGTNAAADGITVTPAAPATGMFFRVVGVANGNRLFIGAYDNENAAGGWSATANANGNSTFAVNGDTNFQLNLFDGEPYDGSAGFTGVWAFNDSDDDGFYGDSGALDLLQATDDWDNSYCINVDSASYTQSTVNVSINSGGLSGSNFLTFNPANPQVAHLISQTSIVLDMCKPDEFGYVSLEGSQNATCVFDYDNATAPGFGGYCQSIPPAVFTGLPLNGNRVIIQRQNGTFYNLNDEYRVGLTISGNGAYWAAAGAANLLGFLPSNTTVCDPAAVVDRLLGVTWPTVRTETGATPTLPATGVGCGTIAVGEQWIELLSSKFSAIHDLNRIVVPVPQVVFDPAVVSAGDQVTMTVDLYRMPCGLVFTGIRVLGEFVDTCAAAAPTTTLYYPYSVELDGTSGWWFGMTIGNPTALAGTATITVVEADGDIGTSAPIAIGAFGLSVMGNNELLALLTPDAANTGTLGDSRTHILVECSFGAAGGFGMMGNGMDSTGYTAYGTAPNLTTTGT